MKTEWSIPVDAMREAGMSQDEIKRVICELARDYDPLYAQVPALLGALQEISAGDTMRVAGRETWTHSDVIQEHYRIAREAISKATTYST